MKKSKNLIYIISGILVIAFQLGCVSPMGMTSSTTPLEGKSMKILGKGIGFSNWSGAIFGLWSVNRPDIERGIKNALMIENRVTILREDDQKELYMKKGAVLSLINGSSALVEEDNFEFLCSDNENKQKEFELKSENSLKLKEGKLFFVEKGEESEMPPCGIIRTGCGVELRYGFAQNRGLSADSPQQPVSVIMQKVKGDFIVYIDDRPKRLNEGEALELKEGAFFSKIEGDALINVRWYERTYFFVFFSLHRVMVSGDIVIFHDRNENNGNAVANEKNEAVNKKPKASSKDRRKSR